MRFEKILSVISATAIVLSMSTPALASKVAVTDPGTYPIVKDKPITFRIFTQNPGTVIENLQTNNFNKMYEQKTNVKIEWDTVTTGAAEKVNLMIASNQLPDGFIGNITDTQLLNWAIKDKIFVPLDDSVKKYGPNIMKALELVPQAKEYAYLPDGKMYALLRIVETYNEKFTKRAWVYEPWLTKLNLKMPQTTEDFYNMLMAFKTKDPNGNGKADEIPFSGAKQGNPANNEPESYILNAFTYYDNSGSSFLLEVDKDGKTIKFNGMSEEYREGLRYLNKLWNENLLDHNTFTQNRSGMLALTEGDSANKLGVAAAMYWGHFTTELGPMGRDMEFVAVPPLKGPKGVRNAYDRGTLINNARLVVTTKGANRVDAIVRWADFFFDPVAMMESGYSATYGKEGIGWEKAKTGEKDVNGEQAKYKLLKPVDVKNNETIFNMVPYFEPKSFLFSFVNDKGYRKEGYGGKESLDKYQPYSAFDKKLPFMYVPTDMLDKVSATRDVFTNTSTGLFVTYLQKFICGDLSLDKDWDAYVSDLKKAKIDDYISQTQKIYDEYLKTKK